VSFPTWGEGGVFTLHHCTLIFDRPYRNLVSGVDHDRETHNYNRYLVFTLTYTATKINDFARLNLFISLWLSTICATYLRNMLHNPVM